MSPFDCAWLVVKAPLDLDSVQELDYDYLSAMEQREAMLRSLLEDDYKTQTHGLPGSIPYQDWTKYIEELSALKHIIATIRRAYGPVYRANHYDHRGIRFPMIAYPQGDGGGEVAAYVGKDRNPIKEIGSGNGAHLGGTMTGRWFFGDSLPKQVGALTVNPAGYGDRGNLVEDIITERMGLSENPFDARIRAEHNPEEYTDHELDEIEANYEEASDLLHEYSEGSMLDVRPSYQRKGIATAMRDFLSELNDNYLPGDLQVDLRPDPNQSFEAQRMWAANQNDPNYRAKLHEIEWRGLRERMGDQQ